MPVEEERLDAAHAGQAVYSRGMLRLYDAIVYGFNCPVVWRCRKSRFLDLYDAFVSARHLDIGVATGSLLDECSFPVERPEITLMDMNPNSLRTAAARLARYAPRLHQANVLESWELPAGSYESVAMMNLLHCVPGDMPTKTVAFEEAYKVLLPGGVLFGASILGQGVEQTWLSRVALRGGNRRGVFCNLNDTLEGLSAGLARVFDSHEVQASGSIALFSARKAA